MNTWHMRAFDPLGLDVDLSLDSIGGHKMRSGKEEHLYNSKNHSSASGIHKTRRL